MAEQVDFNTTFDDSQLTASVERFIQSVERGAQAVDRLGATGTESFTKVGKAVGDQEKQIAGTVKRTMEYAERVDEADKANKDFSASLKGAARNINIFGVNVGAAVDRLSAKRKALLGMAAGLGTATKALRIFKVALLATGIGAAVVALGSLVALLSKTQRGIDFVNRVSAGLSATFSVLVDRASQLGNAITLLFDGKFRQAALTAGAAFSGVTEEIIRETAAATELERRSQSLRDATRDLSVETAKQRAEIEKLRFAARDESLAAADRIKATREALALEEQLEAKRIELAEENLAIIRERNALGESLAADLDDQARAEVELENIREETARRRRRDLQTLQMLLREENARVNELRQAYAEFLDELQTRADEAGIAQLAGVDRLRAEKALALREIEAFRNEVIAAATRAGQDLPENFEQQVAQLIRAVEKTFRDEVDKLQGRTEGEADILSPLLLPDDSIFQERGRRAVERVQQGVKEARPIIDAIREEILLAFDLSEAELEFITDSVSSIFDNVLAGIDAATQAEIAKQDAVIQAAQERVDRVAALLEEEQRRQEQGFANDVEALKKKLAEEEAEKAKAEQKRLQLERKAARQRLIQNSVEQASNLVLAVAKLTAAEASKGLIGVVTALAGAALIFRIISQARAQSAELATPPRFAKGGAVEDAFSGTVQGPSHAHGGKVIEVQGREFVIADTPASEHKDFLSRLNAGDFQGVDLSALLALPNYRPRDLGPVVSRIKSDQAQVRELKSEMDYKAMKTAYEQAATRSADKMISYWQSRPVEKIEKDGSVVREWKEGGVLRRQIVKNK